MLTIALIVLATIAVHRIWHYEDIFVPMRSVLGAKLLIDPTITPLWIAPMTVGLSMWAHPAAQGLLTAFAAYPFMRGAVWVYQKYDPQKTCTPCEKNRKDAEKLQHDMRRWAKRVFLIGADLVQARWMADNHKDWVIVTVANHGTQPSSKLTKNMMYEPLIMPDTDAVSNRLMFLLFNGGNATIVTFNCVEQERWKPLLKNIGTMRGMAWIHVTRAVPPLPAHHLVVVPGEPLDTLIETAKPPA